MPRNVLFKSSQMFSPKRSTEIEVEGAASPSGTEEVLMCEMCQAVLCVKVIRR